jgi:molybdopterin converting factor small subunit
VSIGVTIQYHNILRRGAGLEEELVRLPAGSSVADVLREVADARTALKSLLFTERGDVASHVVVFRNRKLVAHDALETRLVDGDEIKLFPAISGG